MQVTNKADIINEILLTPQQKKEIDIEKLIGTDHQPIVPIVKSYLGLLFSLLSFLTNSILLIITKLLFDMNKAISFMEILFSRSIVSFILIHAAIYYCGHSYNSLTRQQIIKVCARLLLGFPAMGLVYFSIKFLPIGLSSCLNNLAPILTLILAQVILKERMKLMEILNMTFSLMGVILMLMFTQKEISGERGTEQQSFGAYLMAIIAGLTASVFLALNNVIVRSLKGVPPLLTAGVQASGYLLGSVISYFVYKTLINTNFEFNFTLLQCSLMVLTGVFATISSLTWIQAMQYDQAGRNSSLQFSMMVFGYIADVYLFNYSIQTMELFGALIIAACSLVVFILKVMNYSE